MGIDCWQKKLFIINEQTKPRQTKIQINRWKKWTNKSGIKLKYKPISKKVSKPTQST